MRGKFAIQFVKGPELLCPGAHNFSRRPSFWDIIWRQSCFQKNGHGVKQIQMKQFSYIYFRNWLSCVKVSDFIRFCRVVMIKIFRSCMCKVSSIDYSSP